MVFLILLGTGDFPGYQAKDKGCKAACAVQSQKKNFPFPSCRSGLMAQGILQDWENQGCSKFRADADDWKGLVNRSMSISQDSKIFPSSADEQRGREDNPPACWITLLLAFSRSLPGQSQDGEIQSTVRTQ